MSRKIARTFFSTTKRALLIVMPLLAIIAISCGDDNKKEDEPENPQPDETASIIGKWQKYQRVNDDGSLSSGDPDEFWIFEKNNDFSVEDGGEITDIGTYKIEGKTLTIKTYSVSNSTDFEELRGFFEFKDGYLHYQFTEVGENDYIEYRFRKVK